jgi:selenocysteine lyase/cysteine desulfurase
MTLDLAAIRSQFPSLNRPAIFFDNPGGIQIAKQSLDPYPVKTSSKMDVSKKQTHRSCL